MKNKHRNQRKQMTATALTLAVLLALAFQNCAPEHEGNSSSSANLVGNCSVSSEVELFSITWHDFFQNKCASCHVPGGSGLGHFASSGLEVAWEAFRNATVAKVSNKAVDGHDGLGYSGPQNQDKINELNELWTLGQKELVDCEKGETLSEFIVDEYEGRRLQTISKPIDPDLSEASVVSWSLENDFRPLPEGVTLGEMPGARFEFLIETIERAGQPAYVISQPRIRNSAQGSVDIEVKSIRVKVNGKTVINETTFEYLDAKARDNTDTLISAGAMVAAGTIRQSDVISVAFGDIGPTAEPIPDPPDNPEAFFSLAETRLSDEEGNTDCPERFEDGSPVDYRGERCVNVQVNLSEPLATFATVSFLVDQGASTATEEYPDQIRVPEAGNQIVEIMKWDRDYEFVSGTDGSATTGTVRFFPNETSTTVSILIKEDERYESVENIRLELTDFNIVGGGQGNIGSQSTHDVFIPEDRANDPAPNGEITFTMLMEPGGAFRESCLRCHHAGAELGEDDTGKVYNMVGYLDLVEFGRVIPGDPDNSIVWQRITGELQPRMPEDGSIKEGDIYYDDIYSWILSGAKNN